MKVDLRFVIIAVLASTVTFLILIGLTYRAFYLKQHYPEHYTRFWRFWGNRVDDPNQVIVLAFGSIVGLLLVLTFDLLFEPTDQRLLWVLLGILFVFILFVGITLSHAIRRIQTRIEELEKSNHRRR